MAASKCTAPAEITAVSDITCTPCGRTGRRTKPVKFCLECDEYYCSSCLPYHGKFLSTKDHTVEDVSGSTVEFPCTIELATPTDVTLPSSVTSIVRLASGSFLVCDWYNRALKMLDGNYAVVDEVRLTDKPFAVCVFNENEVAVSLKKNKEIVFVSVNNVLRISIRHPIKTEDKCRGMACVNGEMYVGSGGWIKEGPGKVEVYANSGIRTIKTDAAGFGVPYALAVNPTCSEIHITDHRDDVTTINPMGAVLRKYSSSVLQRTSGICMDDQGNLFVAGEKSHNVVKIEQNGSMKVVLSKSDGVVNPTSVF